MDNKDSKRYYYNAINKLLFATSHKQEPIPCSPSLIKQLGTEAMEVKIDVDIRFKYEVQSPSSGLWREVHLQYYNQYNAVNGDRRITAIPVKAVEGVEDKPEEEEKVIDEIIKRLVNGLTHISGDLLAGPTIGYLASLEYRINQLEKTE